MGDSTHMREYLESLPAVISKNIGKYPKISLQGNLIISGAGDKYCVALFLQELLLRIQQRASSNPTVIHPAEILGKFFSEDTTFLFITQSGKTKDVIEAIEYLKEKGRQEIYVITNLKPESSDGGRSVYDLLPEERIFVTETVHYPEKPLPSTETFLASVVLGSELLADIPEDAYIALETALKSQELRSSGVRKAERLLSLLPAVYIGFSPFYPIVRKSALIMTMEGVKEPAFPLRGEEFLHSLVEVLESTRGGIPLVLFGFEDDLRLKKIEKMWRWKTLKYTVTRPKNAIEEVFLTIIPAVEFMWTAYTAALLINKDPGVGKIVKKVRSDAPW